VHAVVNPIDDLSPNGPIKSVNIYYRVNKITVIAYCRLPADSAAFVITIRVALLTGWFGQSARARRRLSLAAACRRIERSPSPKETQRRMSVDNCVASGWHLSEGQLQLLDTKIQYRHRTVLDALGAASCAVASARCDGAGRDLLTAPAPPRSLTPREDTQGTF